MGDFRIPYGFARGRKNNFFARTDNAFTSGDTTPDVTLGCVWYTANSSATVISDFDLSGLPGPNLAPDYEGKEFVLYFTDNNTTILNNSRIILSSSAQTFASNQVMEFFYHNSAWVERGRSRNTTAGDSPTFSIAGSASINVTDAKLVILVGTATPVGLKSISGGIVGQTVTLFQNNTSGITMQIDTGGNLFIPGTSTIVMNASGAYQFTKVDATRWLMNRPVA